MYEKVPILPSIVRDMQISTTMRFPITANRMASHRQAHDSMFWQGCGEGTPVHCLQKYKLVEPLWKTGGSSLKDLQVELACDPAIPLLGIDSKEMKQASQRDTHTPVFIAALFTVNKI